MIDVSLSCNLNLSQAAMNVELNKQRTKNSLVTLYDNLLSDLGDRVVNAVVG